MFVNVIIMFILTCACSCHRRPQLSRHRSELSGTSSHALTQLRRVRLSPRWPLSDPWSVLSLLYRPIPQQCVALRADVPSAGSGPDHPHQALGHRAGPRNLALLPSRRPSQQLPLRRRSIMQSPHSIAAVASEKTVVAVTADAIEWKDDCIAAAFRC